MINNEALIIKLNEYRRKFHSIGRPLAKWKLFHDCNFKCEYCTEWRKNRTYFSIEDYLNIARVIMGILSRNWLIYLTGGELFYNYEITKEVVKEFGDNLFDIRIISNFSFPIENYLDIYRESNSQIKSIFLTLHPDYISNQDFLNKIKNLRIAINSECEIIVRQVVQPNHSKINDFLNLRNELKEFNIELFPLRLVSKVECGRIATNYEDTIGKELYNLIFSETPWFPNRRHTVCPAGFEYIYIDPELDVFTCIPYKNHINGYMGNLACTEISLREVPQICDLNYCSCVPGR